MRYRKGRSNVSTHFLVDPQEEGPMRRTTRLQMLLVLAAGAVMGYAVASGKLNPLARVEAAPPGGQSTLAKTVPAKPGDTPACCSDGLAKGEILALADPKVQAAAARAEASGKKPNILFIMGDDI